MKEHIEEDTLLQLNKKQILKQFDIDEKYLDRSIKEYRY